jgi:Mrp family chromosome partitioning ATPase/capsular polysaccharide biosynthesis protein
MIRTQGVISAPDSIIYRDELPLSTTESIQYEHSDIRDFLTLLRRHIVLIVVVTLVTGVATYVVTSRQASRYAGRATLLYTASSSTEDPARALDTLVGVSSSSAVLGPVARKLGTPVSALASSLSISGDPNADLISIGATSDSSTGTSRIANAVAKQLILYSAAGQKNVLRAQIASLQKQLGDFAGRADPSSLAAATDLRTQLAQARAELAVATAPLSVLSPAATPKSPVSPRPKRDAIIALFAGLVLAVLLSVLRDRLDRRIRNVEELERIYRAPTLGLVPFPKSRRRLDRSKTLANFSGSGALADAYRTIRTNVSLLRVDEQEKGIIVVTSATAEEGKTTITANLAHALSVAGRHVLVVSADLHNPTLYEFFPTEGLGNKASATSAHLGRREKRPTHWPRSRSSAGLVQVLAGEVALGDAVRVVPLSNPEQARGGSLHVLADSSTFFDPSVLLSSAAMQEFLSEAGEEYDFIVFDTPPVLANADATLLGQAADVLILVGRLDHVTKNQARRTVQMMSSARLVPSGVIVTGDIEQSIDGYGYGYGYRSDPSVNGADGRAISKH